MEDFLIPRMSVFLSDMNIWSDLAKFSSVSGYAPKGTIVNTNVDKLYIQPAKASKLKRLFGGVRSHGYQSLATNELSDSILDKRVHTDWRREKDIITKIVKQHQVIMADLKRAQEKCWCSKAKVSTYKLLIATQEAYVALNTEKEKSLKGEMTKMKVRYDNAVKIHDNEYEVYQKLILQEIACREKLQTLSSTLCDDVVDKMAATINRLMTETNQTLSVGETRKLARDVLKMTSRLYHSDLPTTHPCGQDRITSALMIGSKLNNLTAASN